MDSTGGAISDVIAGRVRDLRRREGVSREELAARARWAGAPESFTANAVGFLETGRPKGGRRTREFSIDEVVWCAAALEVSPAELFDREWLTFAGAEPAGCERCAGEVGQLEKTLRADLDAMEELTGLEPSIAAAATRLARAVDTAADPDSLTRLLKEYRAMLVQLGAGRRRHPEPPDKPEDDLGDLDQPAAGADVDLSGIDAGALDEEGPDEADADHGQL